MKWSEFHSGLGRFIVYQPEFTHITGAITAGIFVCNLVQWTGKQRDADGWIFKTQGEIMEETGLTRREQETARKILKDRGFLVEAKRGIPARLFYRVEIDALNDAVDDYLAGKDGAFRHTGAAETIAPACAEPTDYQLTEETAEGTQGLPPPNLLRVREWSEQHGRKR